MQFTEYTTRPAKATGKIGEDTDAVFTELGYSLEEIEQLRSKDAIR